MALDAFWPPMGPPGKRGHPTQGLPKHEDVPDLSFPHHSLHAIVAHEGPELVWAGLAMLAHQSLQAAADSCAKVNALLDDDTEMSIYSDWDVLSGALQPLLPMPDVNTDGVRFALERF